MPVEERQRNQAAFRQLRGFIQKTHPAGRFVAISGGQVVGDAESFAEINTLLHRMGNHSTEVLVVQAGVEYPETLIVFAHEWQR